MRLSRNNNINGNEVVYKGMNCGVNLVSDLLDIFCNKAVIAKMLEQVSNYTRK